MYVREKPPQKGPSLLDQTIGTNSEFCRRLMELGFSQEYLDRLKDDPWFSERVLEFYKSGGITDLPEAEVSLDAIFGQDGYFGIRDWSRYFWVHLSDKQFGNFPEFPWPIEIFDQPCQFHKGKTIRETHAVFLGLWEDNGTYGQFDLNTLSQLINKRGSALLNEFGYGLSMDLRLRDGVLLQMPGPESFRWYMMLIGAVPNTDNIMYMDQLKRLPKEYELPTANEIVISKACFYAKVGRLHQPGDSKWIRASDMPCTIPAEQGICIGREPSEKIVIMARENVVNYHQNRIAIYASRIPGK